MRFGMRHKYRILQLKPDLRRDDVVTIGAFLRMGDEVKFVESPTLPGAKCLGSEKAYQHMQYIRESILRLGEDKWWEDIPSVIGRSVTMGAPQVLHSSQPRAWLRRELLPNYNAERSQSPQKNRATLGKQFFENQGVGQYVKTRYRMDNVYHVAGLDFPNFSLVTVGSSDALLIEPLKFGRETFERNVRDTARKFQAAKYAEQERPRSFAGKPFETVTLLLPGITDQGRKYVEEHVIGSSDHFYDARRKHERLEIRDLVEAVGSSINSPELL